MSDLAHRATTVVFAGALATLAFDLFGQGLSPLLGYAKLAPVPLASSVLKTVFGAAPSGMAYSLHILTGLIAYPLGWWLVARPAARAVLPGLPWPMTAAAYGVALWVFALYGMAHLVAGNAPFLGFGQITWVALVGHVLFALVAAAVIEARHPQPHRNGAQPVPA